MKNYEMRQLTQRELETKAAEKAQELANLKFQLALHQLDDTSKVKITRRELARMKTMMREFDLGIVRRSKNSSSWEASR
ncbi:MAG: 50S ribosomal protein L29 [Calditrichota bacterium]